MKKNSLFLLFFPFISFWIGYLVVQWLHAPAVIVTPSLIGLTMPHAARACQPYLALRVIQTVDNPHMPDGTIISQIPSAGQKIKTHQIICVVISAQPLAAHTPTYIGMSLEECTQQAQQQNCTLQICPIVSKMPKNICIAQIPASGKPLSTNAPIIIYVSAPELTWWIVPNYCHHDVASIQEYTLTDSIALQIIHTNPVSAPHQCNNHCMVIDQRPLAGSVIKNNNKQSITLYVRPLTPETI